MTQAEMELELSGLRRQLALVNADDEARRKKARLLAFFDVAAGAAFLAFSLFLYLHNDRAYLPVFLIALTLNFLGSNVMALAVARTARR